MWKLILVIAIVCTMTTDAEHKKRKRYAGGYAGGGYAGGYAGAGSGAGSYAGGGGYGTGGYAGGGDYGTGGYAGTGFDYAPNFGFGFIDPYEFHQRLTAQILAQHAAQNNALSSTYTSGDAFVSADASSYPDDDNQVYQQQFAQQQALFDAIRRQSQHNKGYKINRYAPSYASASGSIGPGGYHQSAHINPENPASPNIVNRFSSDSGPGGYKGVSVSSFSSSSDIDGKRTSHRGAQTTINDNGKVTTYKVHS